MQVSDLIQAHKSEPLLTPSDFEKEYGVPEGTQAVWRCTNRYGLPYIKLGRLVRYRKSEVEAWLSSRSMGGAAA